MFLSKTLCCRNTTASLCGPRQFLHFAGQWRILTLQIHYDLVLLLLACLFWVVALPQLRTDVVLLDSEVLFRILPVKMS